MSYYPKNPLLPIVPNRVKYKGCRYKKMFSELPFAPAPVIHLPATLEPDAAKQMRKMPESTLPA